jgi:acylphosphatase
MPEPVKIPVSMSLSTPNNMLLAMAPVRKRLIVEGCVQGVGYRALVTFHARNMKVQGFVRNLPDETVEVVCEADHEKLMGFLKAINQKGDPADPLSLNVVSIKDAPPPPEGDLTRFYTDYGRKLTDVQREAFDREEMMVLRAGTLNTNVGVVGKNVLEVGQKVDGVGKAVECVGKDVREVGTAVHDMHTDMNKRFDHMADRYDMIALSLKDAIVHMDRNAEKTDKAIEKSRNESAQDAIRTRKEIAKSQKETAKILSQSRQEITASNRELARAVNFMIKKLSDKPPRRKTPKKR